MEEYGDGKKSFYMLLVISVASFITAFKLPTNSESTSDLSKSLSIKEPLLKSYNSDGS
jgi:hypothetical protein